MAKKKMDKARLGTLLDELNQLTIDLTPEDAMDMLIDNHDLSVMEAEELYDAFEDQR